MHGVERDEFPIQIKPADELARGGDLVAFVLYQLAAEVVLGWRGDGGDDVVTAGVFGLFAIRVRLARKQLIFSDLDQQ